MHVLGGTRYHRQNGRVPRTALVAILRSRMNINKNSAKPVIEMEK